MRKIVVLMSTYNGEKYLSEQIDSILAQQFCDVQLCVRDDGSKDATTQILDEYKAKGQLDWYTGKNLGPGKSFFDLSLHAPEAEYYAFADQDDYWMPDKLKSAIDMIEDENTTDIPIMYCSKFTATDAELKPLEQQENRNYGKITLGHAIMENIAAGCTYVFNSVAMKAFRGFNIGDVIIHDWALYMVVVALGGKVIFDDTSHILYRQHGNNSIGYETNTILKSVIRRWQNKKSYSNSAKSILAVYEKELQSSNLGLVRKVADYDSNLKYKFSLLFSKDLFMSRVTDNIFLKFLLLINWL